MNKYIEKSELKIFSIIALDDLKNYIYVEAMTKADVKEVGVLVFLLNIRFLVEIFEVSVLVFLLNIRFLVQIFEVSVLVFF